MALFARLSRLFRADAHDLLDRIEEPRALLRQAVREMEEEVARDARRLEALKLELTRLAARRDELAQSLPHTDAELDLCFAAGKDDLARALVQRKLEAERFAKHLARKLEFAEQAIASLARRLEQNRRRLDSMREKAELFDAQPGWSDEHCGRSREFTVSAEDVEVALLREKQRRAGS